MSSENTELPQVPNPPGALLAAIRARGQVAPVEVVRMSRERRNGDLEGGAAIAGGASASTPPPSRAAATSDCADPQDKNVAFTPPKLLFSAADLQRQKQKTLGAGSSKIAAVATPAAPTKPPSPQGTRSVATDHADTCGKTGAASPPKLLFSAVDLQRQRQKTLGVGSKRKLTPAPPPAAPQGLAAVAAAAAARAAAKQTLGAETAKTALSDRADQNVSGSGTDSTACLMPSFRSGGPVTYLSQPIKHQLPTTETTTPLASLSRERLSGVNREVPKKLLQEASPVPAIDKVDVFSHTRLATNTRINAGVIRGANDTYSSHRKSKPGEIPTTYDETSGQKKLLKKSEPGAGSRSRGASKSREIAAHLPTTYHNNNNPSLQGGAVNWIPLAAESIGAQIPLAPTTTTTTTATVMTPSAITTATTTTTAELPSSITNNSFTNTGDSFDENGYKILNSPTAIRRAFRKLSCRFLDQSQGYETLC